MQHFENKYYRKAGNIFVPVFLFLILFSTHLSFAQRHEFGLGLGGYTYTGEVNPRYDFLTYRPGGMIFYRYNSINRVTAFRIGASVGQLAGTEKRSNEYTAQIRNASFSSTMRELSLMAEYNFINYRDKKQLLKFSPYMTGGLALYAQTLKNGVVPTNDVQGLNIAIPFGVGIKFILNRNWNLGTEFVARKTFNDYLDGISNAEINHKSTGNPLDDDWYFYTGISLSYTIYGVNCPQQYKY